MSDALGLLTLLLAFGVIGWVAQRNPRVAAPLLIGFGFRVALTLVDSFVFPLPGAGDGIGWDRVAAIWARGGLGGTLQYLDTGHELYIWVMSVLYAVFARSPLMIKGINVCFGSLAIVVIWKLAEAISDDERQARIVAWMVALVPSIVFFSAVLLREVAVSFPLSVSVLYLVRWYRERKNSQVVIALAALVVSMAFHSGGLAVLLFGGLWMVGGWFRAVFTFNFKNFGRSSLGMIAGIGVAVAVLASGFGMDKFQGLETGNLNALSERQENFAIGRTAYLEDLHATSPTDLVWQAPIRLTYFLFAPFPWMLNTGSDLFGVLDSFLFAALGLRVLRFRKAILGNPRAAMVLGVFGAMALVFAIGVSNYGTALRHRNKMLPLLIAGVMSIPAEKRSRAAREAALRTAGGEPAT